MGGTVEDENRCDQESCSSSKNPVGSCMPFDVPSQMAIKDQREGEVEDRIGDLLNLKNASSYTVSAYPEKVLPFNKRKSRYYICKGDESFVFVNEENNSPPRESKRDVSAEKSGPRKHSTVKIRSLKSIYKQTRPVAATDYKIGSRDSPQNDL